MGTFKGTSANNKGKTYKKSGIERKSLHKCRRCGVKTPNYFYCSICLIDKMEVPTDFCGQPIDANDLIGDYVND